jgi:hypothetical protein
MWSEGFRFELLPSAIRTGHQFFRHHEDGDNRHAGNEAREHHDDLVEGTRNDVNYNFHGATFSLRVSLH